MSQEKLKNLLIILYVFIVAAATTHGARLLLFTGDPEGGARPKQEDGRDGCGRHRPEERRLH